MRPGLIFDNALMIQIMLERLKSSTADTRELVSDIRAAVASALSGFPVVFPQSAERNQLRWR